MSEIKVNSIKGVGASSAAITISNTDGTCAVNNTQRQGRNLVVNGGMLLSQRGSSFTSVANNDITLDRFGLVHPYSNHFNISQSTDSPDGFSKSFKLEIANTDSSIGSGQYVAIRHRIEAQNLQQLGFGTSGAKSISLSFYVKSNKTGTFAVNIQQTDNSDKQVSASYTISSANTWERKTFTFAGDTSGVINNDNGTGLTILWWLSAGSNYNSGTSRSTFTAHADADSAVGCNVNILDSTSNNFYLTGVQFETSDAASDFEHLTFAQELTLCQRYFYVHTEGLNTAIGNGTYWTNNQVFCPVFFPVEMRDAPSMVVANDGSTERYVWNRGGGNNGEKGDNWSLAITNKRSAEIYDPAASGTSGYSCFGRSVNADGKITFAAEL